MSVLVIGAAPLPGLGVGGCVVLPDIVAARFDGQSETWTVTTNDGRQVSAALVVDARPSRDAILATHGAPNYFRIPGPAVGRQARYVARCLRLVERSGAGRIEAKRPITLRRWRPEPVATQFYLTGAVPAPDELYDGQATMGIDGRDFGGRVRLIGHLDPIDGQYHWRGTFFEPLPDASRGRPATLTVGSRTGAARIVEQTAWGTHTVSGVGDPPFDR